MIYNFKSFLRLLEAVTWENTKDTTYGKVTSKDGVTINEEIFKLFLQADPTDGKFFRFIAKLYKSMTFEEFEGSVGKIKNLLQRFDTFKGRLIGTQRDIMSYKSLDELESIIESFGSIEEKIEKKSEISLKNQYETIYETSQWVIYVPHNVFASNHIGNFCTWCTTSDPKTSNNNKFEEYYFTGPFFIIKNKSDYRKSCGFHIDLHKSDNVFEDGVMTDCRDNEVDCMTFFKKNPAIYKAIEKYINKNKELFYREYLTVHLKNEDVEKFYETFSKIVRDPNLFDNTFYVHFLIYLRLCEINNRNLNNKELSKRESIENVLVKFLKDMEAYYPNHYTKFVLNLDLSTEIPSNIIKLLDMRKINPIVLGFTQPKQFRDLYSNNLDVNLNSPTFIFDVLGRNKFLSYLKDFLKHEYTRNLKYQASVNIVPVGGDSFDTLSISPDTLKIHQILALYLQDDNIDFELLDSFVNTYKKFKNFSFIIEDFAKSILFLNKPKIFEYLFYKYSLFTDIGNDLILCILDSYFKNGEGSLKYVIEGIKNSSALYDFSYKTSYYVFGSEIKVGNIFDKIFIHNCTLFKYFKSNIHYRGNFEEFYTDIVDNLIPKIVESGEDKLKQYIENMSKINSILVDLFPSSNVYGDSKIIIHSVKIAINRAIAKMGIDGLHKYKQLLGISNLIDNPYIIELFFKYVEKSNVAYLLYCNENGIDLNRAIQYGNTSYFLDAFVLKTISDGGNWTDPYFIEIILTKLSEYGVDFTKMQSGVISTVDLYKSGKFESMLQSTLTKYFESENIEI